MYRASRNKRDSATNLYRNCQISGNCLPDVKNKIEGETLADRLLKWFGSFIYLGNLGIGTGRGTGGTFGYKPITPAAPRSIPTAPSLRPNVLIDPLAPAEAIPVDVSVVDPSGPAIVPLAEGTIPDVSVVDIVDSNLTPGELDVVTNTKPTLTIESDIHPNVTVNNDITTLDIQETGPPPKRMAIEEFQHYSEPTIFSSIGHPDPDVNVFVDSHFEAEIIGGYENIPLEPLNQPATFEIAEPTYSTPKEGDSRFLTRTRDLYRRYIQQVKTTNPNFLGQASRAVQFEYTNPAFDPEVSLIFERDVEAVAAPDPDFADVRALGRQRLSETPGRTVRVSRIGTKGTIHTRSGVEIGPKVHFFMDLSAIPEPTETIELQPLGSFTGEATIVDNLAESTFIHNLDSDIQYTENDLLDEQLVDFSQSQLVMNYTDEDEPVFFIEPFTKPVISNDNFSISVFYPSVVDLTNIYPSSELPLITITALGSDYDLHPSYLRRRRKRKYSEIF